MYLKQWALIIKQIIDFASDEDIATLSKLKYECLIKDGKVALAIRYHSRKAYLFIYKDASCLAGDYVCEKTIDENIYIEMVGYDNLAKHAVSFVNEVCDNL